MNGDAGKTAGDTPVERYASPASQVPLVVALFETPFDIERAPASGLPPLLRPSRDGQMVSIAGRRIYWAMPDDQPDERLPDRAGASGADALVLDTGSQRLLDRFTFVRLSAIADACRARRLGIGFAGRLEPPDVPRLMPLRPVLLGFEAAQAPAPRPADETQPLGPATDAACADRVFIRDFVQEMEVGAYASERGRQQRVRFSVEVDLAPSSSRRAIEDIYSYDRMMDAVRALAARAPQAFVETLAEALANDILSDERVQAVMVRVEKLDLGPAAAGVEIRRRRR